MLLPSSHTHTRVSELTLKEGSTMADKQAQALERLTAKLSALRKTLRGEERKLLDQMVLNAQSEVTAHSKVTRPIARPTTRPSGRISLESDVELHSASVRRIQ